MKDSNLSISLLVIVVLAGISFSYNGSENCLLYINDTLILGIVSVALILIITISNFRLTVNLFDLSFLLLIIYKACRIATPADFSNINLFVYLLIIIVYLTGKYLYHEKTQQIGSLYYLSLLGGIVALTGFVSTFTNFQGSGNIFIQEIFPLQGQYTGTLAVLFPFPFFALKYSTSKLQSLVLKLCALLLIGIGVLTISLSLWISIIVIAWLYIAGTKKHKTEFYVLSIVGVIATAVIFFRINEASILGRINIWMISLQLFADHLWLGIGTGRFAEVYPSYQVASYVNGGNMQNLFNAAVRFDPYNEYLRGLVEGGLIYIVCIALILISFFVLYKKRDNRKVTSPFLYSLISLGIYSLFYYPFESIITVILSTLICSTLSCSFHNEQFKFDSRNSKSFLKFLFIGLLSGSIYLLFTNYRNATTWYNAQLTTNSNPVEALASFIILAKAFPNNGDFLMDYGNCLYLNGQTERALLVIDKSVTVKPSTQKLMCIGAIYNQASYYQQAIQSYRKAADLTPYLLSPKEKLFDLYINLRDSVSAANIAKEIIEQPVKVQNRTADTIRLKATNYLNHLNTINYN